MRALILIAGLAAGCNSTSTVEYTRCQVTLDSLVPAAAAVGEAVVLNGGPQTNAWDTSIYVGQARATVISVDRSEGCDTCDTCRSDEGCTACGDCDACDLACAADCVETATFEVPADAPVGPTQVVLYNGEGSSEPLPFEVTTPGGDGGGTDGGGGPDGGGAR